MKRFTEKNKAGSYEIKGELVQQETDIYTGAAAERLACFENAYEALLKSLADTEEKLEEMRSQGKSRSVTFQQFLGRKINYENLLNLFEIHGIEGDV